ncbi:MAG TPA: methyltransferase domain-containing protein [Flavilitoribacter sp.]|nr:methyltransferase domain-containing protein [Flavilitoribacter sp.]HMQ88209.1 methyltransferase domain-containing protein [Flavilitoribacter sp.]
MDKTYEKQYHQLERTHFWFVARRKKVISLMEIGAGKKYLDIGCSSGFLLSELIDSGAAPDQVYGVDISDEAIAACKAKGLDQVFKMDATRIELPENHFDYIVASDCLEHLNEDRRALDNWQKLLKPGGRLILFVPAYMFLWSPHDVVNHHFRRYTSKELTGKVLDAHFTVQRHGYWNFTLFLPILFYRLLRKALQKLGRLESPDADLKPSPAIVNRILLGLLRAENVLTRYLRFPFGVSVYCIAGKEG